jgi:hypothetical protein
MIFAILVLAFAVIDFVYIGGVDPITKEGRGYNHRVLAGQWAGAFETENAGGWNRVVFNFRHFFKWWVVLPKTSKPSVKLLLTCDGNGLLENLGGHLGGSTILVLLALWLFGSIPLSVLAGTAINIFHEYVAEGNYCDPSLVDLWLDQAGILLAVAFYGMITSRILRNRSFRFPLKTPRE